jgi:tetratricopeptide (TPR) repeat protein
MSFQTVALMVSLLGAWSSVQDAAGLKHTTEAGRLAPLLDNLGNLHVTVTTSIDDTQRYFDQGMRLIYAFNHAEALRSFREAARNDDHCAMAYWGQALALSPNINDSAIGPDREQQGHDAIREAVKRRTSASEKEQALIDALQARFAANVSEGERVKMNAAYARAMRGVWSRFPKDPDVATLYADAVMNTRPWDYWTKDGKPQPGIADARAALEQTIRLYPDHPGAHHAYIHLMEASDEVDLAIPSADRLGQLMPGAGHLVHMPSHIYIRVGRYEDAAAANIKAIAADEDYITQCRAQGIYPALYYPHNTHFLAAVLAMEGRSADALQAARKVASQHGHDAPDEGLLGFAHILRALPMMTMVRFGHWEAIEKEATPAADWPFVRSIYHFGRGMAFSATARPALAETELGLSEQQASHTENKKIKILDLNSLADIAQIGIWILRGDIAEKAGRHEEAIAAFQRAVTLEDGLLYSEPPDWFIPPRQYLAQAYMAAGEPAEAERVYRADLKRHRQNGWSLRGLEQSLRKQGKQAEANRVHEEFRRAWQWADVQLAASRF